MSNYIKVNSNNQNQRYFSSNTIEINFLGIKVKFYERLPDEGLKRYIRSNTKEINFLGAKNKFYEHLWDQEVVSRDNFLF